MIRPRMPPASLLVGVDVSRHPRHGLVVVVPQRGTYVKPADD
ncbi:MAG TPA: hypothetical protein VFZ32_01465 [Micromonosporaceae bacterium]